MVVVGISSKNMVRGKGKIQMYKLCNINKQIAMNEMM